MGSRIDSGKSIYVIGGQQRNLRSLRSGSQSWYEYEKGIIIKLDLERKKADVCVEYVSPPDVCADDKPAILFKSGTVVDNKMYVCTQTEVMVYELPHFRRVGYLSLPRFNDLHHVRPTPDGTLLIVNTGLDMVLEATTDGEVVRDWDVLGRFPWQEHSRDVDYRKVPSTKPHKSHPNYVFYVGDDIWVTRFEQKDAVCLTKVGQRIAIGLERVHDGVPHGDAIYFTTIDGKIAVADASTHAVTCVHDLTKMHNHHTLLGWCRGIHIDPATMWVGFSRLRPTKIRDNVSWVKSGFRRMSPTHLACYDLENQSCLCEIDVERYGVNAIFSILPAQE